MNIPRVQTYATPEETTCDYCAAPIYRGQEATYLRDGPCLVYCSEACALDDEATGFQPAGVACSTRYSLPEESQSDYDDYDEV